jgi:hypothetical protein
MKRRMDQRHVTLYLYLQTTTKVLIRSPLPLPPSLPLLSRKQPNEEVALRCETVLNTTMAEIETYHTQKVEDFASLAKEHLDGEIEFYEQVGDIKNSILKIIIQIWIEPTQRDATYRSSTAYAQRAAHSSHLYTHVSRAARANHPSTSATSTIPD